MFVADGGECLAAQSYAKNMGLYGERVGALSIVSHYSAFNVVYFNITLLCASKNNSLKLKRICYFAIRGNSSCSGRLLRIRFYDFVM